MHPLWPHLTKLYKSFEICIQSFGEFEVTNQYSKDISRHLAAPGVIEVNINVKLETSSKSTIRNEVTKAVQAKLGFNLPSNFDHVIYILEKCYVECGWAGEFGDINHLNFFHTDSLLTSSNLLLWYYSGIQLTRTSILGIVLFKAIITRWLGFKYMK